MSIKVIIQKSGYLSEQLWDQADQFLVLRPSERRERSHLSSYILFVGGLLGAAASQETSF